MAERHRRSPSTYTRQDLSDMISFTKNVAKNHPDYPTRLRVKIAVAVIEYLDRTDPSWRDRALEQIHALPADQEGDFLSIVLGDAELVLGENKLIYDYKPK